MQLRPLAEIAAMLDFYYCLHWHARNAQYHGQMWDRDRSRRRPRASPRARMAVSGRAVGGRGPRRMMRAIVACAIALAVVAAATRGAGAALRPGSPGDGGFALVRSVDGERATIWAVGDGADGGREAARSWLGCAPATSTGCCTSATSTSAAPRATSASTTPRRTARSPA